MLLIFYQGMLGLICSLIIAVFGFLAQLLTFSGVVVSVIVGTLVIAIGPWYSIFLLGAFFVSSGLIHKTKKYLNKTSISFAEKGAQRDGWQVLANSLPAVISLFAYKISGNFIFVVGYAGAICGATADTWASEIGVLSRKSPRLITTFRSIPRGQSGGVSLLGTLASVVGAGMSAILFYCCLVFSDKFQLQSAVYLLIPMLAGIFDSLVDSLLGATIQGVFRCKICSKLTEKRIHHSQETERVKGFASINNDHVNFLSGLSAVLFSIVLSCLF